MLIGQHFFTHQQPHCQMLKTSRLNEVGPARKLRSAINKLLKDVESLRVRSGVGYRVKATENGQVLEIKTPMLSDTDKHDIKVVRIDSVQEDTITCHGLKPDYTPSSIMYKVAKPRYLRYPEQWGGSLVANGTFSDEPAGNQKVTYSFGDISYTITERIRPYYNVEDYLYIIKLVAEAVLDENNEEVEWMDLNIDGRQWVPDLRTYTVCDNTTGTPVEKTAYFSASDPR